MLFRSLCSDTVLKAELQTTNKMTIRFFTGENFRKKYAQQLQIMKMIIFV